MKKSMLTAASIALVLSLLGSTSPVHAGNEGPNAAPRPPAIASIRTSIGFALQPRVVTLSVNAGAQVYRETQVFEHNGTKPETTTEDLMTLSGAEMTTLLSAIQAVTPGKVVPNNPHAQPCMDAPSTAYLVYQKGQEVRIAERNNCMDYELDNGSAHAALRFLKELDRRAN